MLCESWIGRGRREEHRREGHSPEEIVLSSDGARESCYANVEDTRENPEGLVWGYERLDPVFQQRVRDR